MAPAALNCLTKCFVPNDECHLANSKIGAEENRRLYVALSEMKLRFSRSR